MEEPSLSDAQARALERAAAFARGPKMLAAFFAATRDAKTWNKAQKDADAFLKRRNVKVPSGLSFRFLEGMDHEKPAPDTNGSYILFSIRFFNCRSYWIKNPGSPPEKVEICWGFEIIPRPIPPIG